MSLPRMILFDFGQTLVSEPVFDGVAGTRAVLEQCARNPRHVSAEEIQSLADALNNESFRYDPNARYIAVVETHNHMFQRYLYEYFGIEMIKTPGEVERVFWDSAAPAAATEGIAEALVRLNDMNIRTGVISNISLSGQTLRDRIDRLLPHHRFEIIIPSSEYVFRKPHRRIFEIALRKAELSPHEVWYCGDDIICDVQGAYDAGITPVWYTGALRKDQGEPAVECLRIGHWRELIKLIG